MGAKTELFVRKQAGGLFTVVREDITTGEIFFVHSGTGSNSNTGKNPDAPLATLAYAKTLATASKGDRIYLMPGHAEDVIAAGTITLDVIGLQVIGLGTGALRPTFTFKTAVGATVAISGASTYVKNVVFDLTGIDAITTGVNVTGADVTIEDCYFLQADAGGQAVRAVTVGAAAHRLTIKNCRAEAPNAGATHFVYCAGAATDVKILNNCIDGDFSTAAVHNDTAGVSRWCIAQNIFNVQGTGKSIVMHAASTGNVVGNHSLIAANIGAGGSMTAAAMFKSENYAAESAHVDASSQLDPAAGGWA